MAETEHVTRDELRAELAEFRREWAEFRAEMVRFREEMRGELAHMRVSLADTRADLARLALRMTRWVPVSAGIGGLAGGLVAAAFRLLG